MGVRSAAMDEDSTPTYGLEQPEDETSNTAKLCEGCGAAWPDGNRKSCSACGFGGEDPTETPPEEGIDGAPKPNPAEDDALLQATAVKPFAVLASVVAIVIALVWFAGWLTPEGQSFWSRSMVVLRMAIAAVTLVAVGTSAFKVTSMVFSRPMGVLNAVVARVAVLVAVAGVVTLIPIDLVWLQFLVRALLGLGLIASGGILVLRLKGALLGTFMLSWFLILASLLPLASLIAWSFGG